MEQWALNITVSYTLSEDVDLDESIAGIAAFVQNVGRAYPGTRYLSGQSLADERVFRHTIRVRTKEELACDAG